MRHRHQNGISPPALRTGLNFLHQLTTTGVKGLNRAQSKALRPSHGHGIAGIELGALELRDHEELQTDGAAADDENGFSRSNASFLDGLEDRVDGFDERGFFEGDVIGESRSEEHTSELQSQSNLVCR